MLNSDIKLHAKRYGIFLGIIVAVIAVLISMTLASRYSWKTGLADEMQTVLDEYSPKTYTVNKYIELKTPLTTSAAVYSLIKKGASNSEKYYGVMVRIPTILGPVPAVFIYNENSAVNFAGVATDTGKAKDLINLKASSGNLTYWESMIPKIIEKSNRK